MKLIDKINQFRRINDPKREIVGPDGYYIIGVRAGDLNRVAKENAKTTSFEELSELIASPVFDYRELALKIMVEKMAKATDAEQNQLYDFYRLNQRFINSWALVDIAAHYVVGRYLYNQLNYQPLFEMVRSNALWTKRIAIVSTWWLIRKGELEIPLEIIALALNDSRDLIHKAMGWMLREVGKRNMDLLNTFIKEHYQELPRTTLRYAIERHDEVYRQAILKGIL